MSATAPGILRLVAYTAVEEGTAHARPPHRGLPSSTLTLVVATDAPLLCSATEQDWAVRRGSSHRVCLGGFHLQPVYLQRPDRQEGVQVALHPLAARRVLGLPAAALTGLTQEGEDVLGPRLRALHARVASVDPGAPGERKLLVAETLADLAASHDRPPWPRREVVGAWRLLELSGGRMRVADVADRVGLTPRHLSSLVRAELGIGTKQLADLLRFEAAHTTLVGTLRRDLRANSAHVGTFRGAAPPARAESQASAGPALPSLRLADLAHAHGYADHAHLDAAYRRYAGTSPSSWVREEFGPLTEEVGPLTEEFGCRAEEVGPRAEEFRNIQDDTPPTGAHS